MNSSTMLLGHLKYFETFQGGKNYAFEDALGQFVLYNRVLSRYDPNRQLYLAVTDEVYKSVFEEEVGQILLEDQVIRLITFNTDQEEIVQWIP